MRDDTWIIEASYRGGAGEHDWSPWVCIGEHGYRTIMPRDGGFPPAMTPRTMVACINRMADFCRNVNPAFTMLRMRDLVTAEIIPGEIF